MPKPFRILSIDGGGIRGLIPALVLAELERRTGRPISACFDLIAGTSTGGILALGLSMPGRVAGGVDDLLLVSLGTGIHATPYRYEDARGWGVAGWARPILDVIFDGVADTVDYQLRQLLPPGVDGQPRYLRFQTDRDARLSEMDDASPGHLDGLQRAAEAILRRQEAEVEALLGRLAG